MAKNTSPVRAEGKEYTIVAGSFCPDSGNNPTTTTGTGFTVVWTSTGLFTITFTEAYPSIAAAHAHLQLASGDDKFAQLGTFTAATATAAATCTVRIWDVSAAPVADVTANANNIVHFFFVFRRSGVTT